MRKIKYEVCDRNDNIALSKHNMSKKNFKSFMELSSRSLSETYDQQG